MTAPDRIAWALFAVVAAVACTGPAPSPSGVFPHLAAVGGHTPRTEAGIGALVPWADRLWFVTYVSHAEGTGSGTGLYEIDASLTLRRHPASRVGTYANRMVHAATDQLFIGPYAIDPSGSVRTVEGLVAHRLAATSAHLTHPDERVLVLSMEGLLFEVDARSLEVTPIADLRRELDLPAGARPHFKSAYTGNGRVVVANNTWDEREHRGVRRAGRLAEWDGGDWRILDDNPYVEVAGSPFGGGIYALGWDPASVLLKVHTGGAWATYRLPRASHAFDHAWTTEWMRIREVESERLLLDSHGMFYELPVHLYGGRLWGLRPISTHLRVVPDFASWRGMLVLAGNQATPMNDANPIAGQPQAGLWFGKTDDLWGFGKPAGWGGPWRETPVDRGAVSDPFLMTGFDHKVVHLSHGADSRVTFTLEVDFLGDGSWRPYRSIEVPPRGYEFHVFPEGFSAHWVRVRVDTRATVTAWFVYS